jgi:hypothetical protein
MSILKKHLIEVSHPKEKNGIWVLTLNLEILLDHGGDGLCRHLGNNLTESGGVVKWKTLFVPLPKKARVRGVERFAS